MWQGIVVVAMSYERGGRSRGGFRGSKGGGRGVGRGNHRLRGDSPSISQNDSTRQKRGKILLLHGNRQTGEILLGKKCCTMHGMIIMEYLLRDIIHLHQL